MKFWFDIITERGRDKIIQSVGDNGGQSLSNDNGRRSRGEVATLDQ